MQYFVYIIHSASTDWYYVGQTQDLENRLFRHRNSGSKATKFAKDWCVVYYETFDRRADAIAREKFIKSMKNRQFIQNLISSSP